MKKKFKPAMNNQPKPQVLIRDVSKYNKKSTCC